MTIKSFYSKETLPNTVIESMVIGRNDKRDYIRMSIESEVSFNRPGSSDVFSGKTVDLSATGIRFLTQSPVKVGEMLEVVVKPGVDVTPPLASTMAVVRVIQSEDGKDYDVAGVMRTPSDQTN
ncbi:PilZ domain-containing protein [Pseudomonadota bacterium]